MTFTEASNKTTSNKSRYGHVPSLPAISDPSQLVWDDLQPGQKQGLKIKLVQSQQLVQDVLDEIHTLQQAKQQAKLAKNIQMVDQMEGLQHKLTNLEKKLQARIRVLTKQLQPSPSDASMWLARIQSDCANYLTEVQKAHKWLYSGTHGDDAHVGKSWMKREPLHSNKQAQQLFDQLLAQTGAVALRGNCIFATSDYDHTKQFSSKTYIIFPVDHRSHYTYTNEHDITFASVDDVATDMKKLTKLKKELSVHVQQIKQQLGPVKKPGWLMDLDYATRNRWTGFENIRKSLQSIKASDYAHMIPEKYFRDDLIQDVVNLETFVATYDPQTTNLAQALKQGVEVYVSGVYYALRADVYGGVVTDAFGVPVETSAAPRDWV